MAVHSFNLGKVTGKSALEIYNEVNHTTLTESEFINLLFKDKTIFESMDEALSYLNTSHCQGGQLLKIRENEEYGIYIVQPDSSSESGWTIQEANIGSGNVNLTILSFTNDKNYVEIGSIISNITFMYELNMTPYELFLNDIELDIESNSYTLSTTISKTTTFTLSASLKKQNAVTKDTTITFCNGVYYGASLDKTLYDSSLISSLTKKIVNTKSLSFSIDVDTDEFVFFALPVNYGTPIFSIGGFDYEFDLINTISYTNSQGYTEDYNIYRSGQKGLGSIYITVK